ncbi:zinc finger protein 510-like [Mytilus californianus]|uniref:zinc finger protein 510-like n=1 Tax=Mytilus californianus TaxID=6549 RepID=UPI00224591DD|nr:zinc finger protein 510-like [Mytilus californianus]XP_052094951.1 zinc finger protein 510-like [Mytilus californianus]
MDFRRVTGPFIHNSTINEEQTINHDRNKSKDEQGEHANSNEASFLEIAERLLGKSEMVSLRQVNEELKSTEIACDIESGNINTMKGEIILPGTTTENKNTFQYRLNGIDLQKTGESSDTCNRNDQFIDNIMNVNQSFEDENSMTENTEQNKLYVMESEKPDTNYSQYTVENIKSNNQDNHSLGDHLTKILNPSYSHDSHDSDSDSIEEELEQNRKQSVDNDIKKSVQENVAIKFDKGSQTFMYLSSPNQSNPKDMGSISKKFVPQTETCISDRELPYKCKFCDQTFSLFTQLKRHTQIHTKDAPFTCETCGRVYRNETELKKHRKKHDGVRPHVCKECGKTFRQLHQLQNHERIHSGEKPFLCETCGQGFGQKENLRLHERTHSGFKPHKCAICGKTFNNTKCLHRHELTHSGERNFPCTICGKSYLRNDHLRRHKRSHGEEPRFRCSFCGKGFHQKVNVEEHERIHTGTKPFTCEVCGKAFTQRGNLKSHLIKHSFV